MGLASVFVYGNTPTLELVRQELVGGLSSLSSRNVLLDENADLLVGIPSRLPQHFTSGWQKELNAIGREGFILRTSRFDNESKLILVANTDIGLLYGAFALLRRLQIGGVQSANMVERPRVSLRLLNHWDNLDGTIERGYAGRSLWKWDELPGNLGRGPQGGRLNEAGGGDLKNAMSPRYALYARACASIGINGTVLNNVNADARILQADYLAKVGALADVFRPYGLRVFLSANFASPKMIGGVPTSDPMHPGVRIWWKKKAQEIYDLIPDFGGFLVKANSEGQPGPQDYGRTHADGANMLADALAPHGGIVIWRAFVYDEKVDPDRIKRAYKEFKPLDGKFRDNVMLQVKNGPLDFMPREPFHPLFGAMEKTPVMAEVQATQEYLGQSKHLVFLGTMWKEFLDTDTHAHGDGSMVGRVLSHGASDGHDATPRSSDSRIVTSRLLPIEYPLTGIAAVANTGDDANWCGHDFSQANWYAFGRLAWDYELPAEHIAEEWIYQTFTRDSQTAEIIKQMMMSSRETFVDYSMPLGLHHLIGGDHYAPMPWNDSEPREDWTAVYYHRAGPDGIGVDRTKTGDGATAQYFPPVAAVFDDIGRCPEKLLLWFHRVPWNYRMKSGRPLHEELRKKYFDGHEAVVVMQQTWLSLKGRIDSRRHAAVARRLAIQVGDSKTWRDACVNYFQGIYLRAGRAAAGGALRL